MKTQAIVLRLGHRIERDKRITTHCALVARAFGAGRIAIAGEQDKALVERVNKLAAKWGSSFKASFAKNARAFAKTASRKGAKIVHLTMYGLPVQEQIKKIRKEKKLLVIVGGEKVPREYYDLADYNVAVTSQPHSEVAALAVFLHELFEGKELEKKFSGAKVWVVPQKKGKKVEEKRH